MHSMVGDTEALFVTDGITLVPTPLTQGPWIEGAQHGGPPAALLARAIEGVPTESPMEVVRLTVELERPVPLEPLSTSARVVRQGRRVQLVATALRTEETTVARASGLRLRLGAETPVSRVPKPAPPGPEEGSPVEWSRFAVSGYHDRGVDMRSVAGDVDGHGPATMWIRLRVPIVAGEEATPLQRAAAVADFGNGLSAVLDPAEFTFINPDLTVYVYRRPVGEWICLQADTDVGDPGIGLASSTLYDRAGPFGLGLQSLLLSRR